MVRVAQKVMVDENKTLKCVISEAYRKGFK